MKKQKAADIKLSNIDWKLRIDFWTAVPVSLIRHEIPSGRIEWFIPASLLRGRIRTAFMRVVNSFPDTKPPLCDPGNDPNRLRGVCLGEDIDSRCVICRTFGSTYTASRLHVGSALLAPGQKVKTSFRLRAKTMLRQGLPIDTGSMIDVTQHGLQFTAVINGAVKLTEREFLLLKGSIRSIYSMGWGTGYGLSLCSIGLQCDDGCGKPGAK